MRDNIVDLVDIVDKIAGNRREQSPRIQLIPFDEIKLGTQRRYLVKNLIPRVGLTVVWGPPKCGKSFWAFDVMMHCALRWNYRDRRVHPGPVVYCAFEGQTGLEARVEAFRQRFLPETPDKVPFYLQPVTLDLVRDRGALITGIKAQLGDRKPVAVTLDTLNRSIRGSESSDEDMTAYVNAADAIRAAFDCAVLIVHHCGIEGTRPRGHTSLTGAVDAQLAVKRDAANNVIVTVEYMKDGPEGDAITSQLERVIVGLDDDRDEISSCVIIPAEDPIGETTHGKKLSPQQQLAVRALTDLAVEIGAPPPATWGLPASVRAVPLDAWRQALLSRGVLEDNDRKRFWDLKTRLKARAAVAERDGLIWSVA
jgi:hypothetical protein